MQAAVAPQATSPEPQVSLHRSKILVVGTKGCGKTSIIHKLFKGVSGRDTLFIETTPEITTYTIDTVIPIEIWDTPGTVSPKSLGTSFADFSCIIFVIDFHNQLRFQTGMLSQFCSQARQENTDIKIEVFCHKTETVQDDVKNEFTQQVDAMLEDLLREEDELVWQDIFPNVSIVTTSVYDYSINLEFSKALQRLIGSLSHLEQLLNTFVAQTSSTKAFLFDTRSLIFVASDSSPVDTTTHDLCCDFVSLLNKFGPLYQVSPIDGQEDASSSKTKSRPSVVQNKYPAASTSLSAEKQRPMTIIYNGVTAELALVAILPTAMYDSRRGMLGYNIVWLSEGVQNICEAEIDGRKF